MLSCCYANVVSLQNCDRSKHVVLAKKCAMDAFNRRTKRGGNGTSQLDARIKMSELFSRANIFPPRDSVPRTFTSSFFWDLVQRPTNVGSKKDKNLEKRELTKAEKYLHDRLCKAEHECADYEDFDVDDANDDDMQSNTSSVFARDDDDSANVLDDDAADADDWEHLNEKDRDDKIGDALKHMGNVKKRKMSDNILCDMLGKDGLKGLEKFKAKRQKKLAKEEHKIDLIYTAVRYFDMRMKKRQEYLLENIKKSVDKTYNTTHPSWKISYETIKRNKYS